MSTTSSATDHLFGATDTTAFPSQSTPAAIDPLRPPAPEEIALECELVSSKQLNPDLMRWIEDYSHVGKRNLFLWKWCRRGVELTTLSCVDPGLYDEVCDTKVLGVMLDVLMDDIADHGGDPELLEQLLNVPFGTERLRLSSVAPEDRAYAEFALDVWQEIKRRTRRFPAYSGFSTLWRFDYLQLFNAMRYSHMLNQNVALLNMAEHDLYLPHNMHIMISATADLMCSPDFQGAELGRVREAVWNAQCMGRIGNLATTWERELGEGDYTSGVYARAVAEGDLDIVALEQGDRERILQAIRNGGHESYFFERWLQLRQRLQAMAPRVRSVDLLELLKGYERLIRLHLISRGQK